MNAQKEIMRVLVSVCVRQERLRDGSPSACAVSMPGLL